MFFFCKNGLILNLHAFYAHHFFAAALLSCARNSKLDGGVYYIKNMRFFKIFTPLCQKVVRDGFFFQYKVINPASIHYKAVPFFDKRRH